MKLGAKQKKLLGLVLVVGLLAACQTVPENKKPQQPQTAEEFRAVLGLTQSQYLRVETILNQFLSDQKQMKEKLSENKEASGAVSEGVHDKLGRLAQLAAQDLKPYLTPEQLALFVELTQGQKAKGGGRGGGRHSGSGGGMGMGHGGMGSSGF